tara:strand:+ start:89 stop:1009 length:921 start_codon:yes stop_codon:yes gene_type:complete
MTNGDNFDMIRTTQQELKNLNGASMNVPELIKQAGFRRGLRPKTIKTYIYTVNKFLRTYHKQPHQITKKDIENHLRHLLRWNRSGSTLNVHLSALKFFYEKVLNKRLTVNIFFTRERKRDPTFLTKNEIKNFCNSLANQKHTLLVTLLYSAGLRVNELVNLRVGDLDFELNYGWVRDGKGGKDRIFVIANRLKDELRQWISKNKLENTHFLFTGYQNTPYSTSAIREIIKKARNKAGIAKTVTPHTLRHSFATHLAQNGYSALEIQPLLGHKSIETTMIYTHLARPALCNVQSPLDSLYKKQQSEV